MAEERLIDLGYGDVDGDWLEEPERRPRNPVGQSRLIGVATLVLVCLIVIGGAALPPPAMLTHVGLVKWLDMPRDDRMPSIAAGLVTMPIDGEVLAYHPDGRPAWKSRPVFSPTAEPSFFDVFELDGYVALARVTLRRITSNSGPRSVGTETVALDPATGQERWRLPGAPTRVGDLVMMMSEASGEARSVRIYRSLPDGLIWTSPEARMTTADPAQDALFTLTDQGLLTEYALSTGTVRRTAALKLPHVNVLEQLNLRVFRDRMVVQAIDYNTQIPVERSLSYDRATLQPVAQTPMDRLLGMEECGPVLCGYGDERPYILDRDTLEVLWRAPPNGFIIWTASGLLHSGGSLRLVDERTGQTRVDATGWEPVYYRRRSSRDVAPAVVIRRFNDRAYIGHLTPRGIRVLGSVQRELRECQSYQDLMVCRAANGGAEVWRLDLSR